LCKYFTNIFAFFVISTKHLLSKCEVFPQIADILDMKLNGEYFSLQEMADKLNLKFSTVSMRLHRLGIEPVTSEALYDKSALEAIRNVPGKGRPKKQPEPTVKKAKK
jgi:hypothetical protein